MFFSVWDFCGTSISVVEAWWKLDRGSGFLDLAQGRPSIGVDAIGRRARYGGRDLVGIIGAGDAGL